VNRRWLILLFLAALLIIAVVAIAGTWVTDVGVPE
jgi:hypothetical protein